MKLLRETIRQLIKEGLYFDELKNLALYEDTQSSGSKVYILFHPNLIDEIIDDDTNIDDWAKSPNALAMMKISPQHPKHDYDSLCHLSWQVKLAGAKRGWGPTMYDIVMGDSPNGIMADRMSVSDFAYDVWDFYHKNRGGDIEKKPLDWWKVRWTWDDNDDCDWGDDSTQWQNRNDWEEYQDEWGNWIDLANDEKIGHDDFISDPLNWVYNREPVPNREALRKNFIIAAQKIEDSDRFWVPAMWRKLASKIYDISVQLAVSTNKG